MEIDNQEIKLQSQIANYIFKDNEATSHFFFIEPEDLDDDRIELKVFTFNKSNSMNFLFHKVMASNKMTALSKMSNYISEDNAEKNYSVIWELNNDEYTSHFKGNSVEHVMSKFFDGKRNRDDIEILNVNLLPKDE